MSGTAEPIDLRRRWLVITLATIVMQFAYWPSLASIAAATGEGTEPQAGLLAFGLAVLPFSFVVLAFGSRVPDAAMGVLKAMGLFLLVGLPLVVLIDAVGGMVAGLAAGGVVALAREPEVHSVRLRWLGVAVVALYVVLLRVVAADLALLSGAVIPFAVHGFVDQAVETR